MSYTSWLIVLAQLFAIAMSMFMCFTFLRRINAVKQGLPLLGAFVVSLLRRAFEMYLISPHAAKTASDVDSLLVMLVYVLAFIGFAGLYSLDLHRHCLLNRSLGRDDTPK